MAKTSLAKKILSIIGLVFAAFTFFSPLIPMFTARPADSQPTYCNLVSYYGLVPDGRSIAYIVIISVAATISGVAGFFFVRCLLSKPLVGDKEDKSFVFACTFFILSNALFGAMCFSMGSYIPTFIGLGLGLLGIGAIVLHFKVLSDI